MRKRLHGILSTDCGRISLDFVSHSLFLTLSVMRQTVSYTRRSNKGYVFNIHIYISYNHTFLLFLSRTYKITKSHSFNRKFKIQASIMILLRGEMWRVSITCMYLHTNHTHTRARAHIYTHIHTYIHTVYIRTLYIQCIYVHCIYRCILHSSVFTWVRSK